MVIAPTTITTKQTSSSSSITKSPQINCDLVSFPPLLINNATNHHQNDMKNTNQLQNIQILPVTDKLNNDNNNKNTINETEAAVTAQLDPAIICISNSANSIPTTPTIVMSDQANVAMMNGGASSGGIVVAGAVGGGAGGKIMGKKQQVNLSKILLASVVTGNNESIKSGDYYNDQNRWEVVYVCVFGEGNI